MPPKKKAPTKTGGAKAKAKAATLPASASVSGPRKSPQLSHPTSPAPSPSPPIPSQVADIIDTGDGMHSLSASGAPSVDKPSGRASPGPSTSAAKRNKSLGGNEKELVVVPGEDQLLNAQRFNELADQLSRSLVVLRTRMAAMEQRAHYSGAAAVLPFQIRRARAEKEQLAREIKQTDRTIKKLLLMSEQMDKMKALRADILLQTREELEREIVQYRERRDSQIGNIRAGYIERINMLQRYWPWRQLLELGDTSVGSTFEEELARGPRYRNVGIQNNIQFDYIAQQLRWVSQLVEREDAFRTHLRHLDSLVEDLNDINELLESSLTCSVCHLLYEDPVLFWPCGHTFCQVCFDSLAIAPSLYRCPTCGSIGSEGFLHNLLVGDTVSKWMFKEAGYGDLQEPLNKIRMHLSRFRKQRMESKIADLKQMIQEQKQLQAQTSSLDQRSIDITYRAF